MLQYTLYAMMMPFAVMGGDQLADSWLGEPGIVDTKRFRGDDGAVEGKRTVVKQETMQSMFNIKCV